LAKQLIWFLHIAINNFTFNFMNPAQKRYTSLFTILPLLTIFITISWFVPSTLKAQVPYYKPYYEGNRKTLSDLKTLIHKSSADTSRVKYLLGTADYFLDKIGVVKADMDSAAYYLKKSYQLATAIGSLRWQHNTLMEYGQYFAEVQQRDKQQRIYEKAIGLARKHGDKRMEADSWFYYYNNSITALDAGSLKTALKRAAYARALYLETKDTLRGIMVLKSIADYHLQLGNYTLAEKEMLEVIAVYRKIQFTDICMSYDLLSAIYNHKGELSKALYYALATIRSYKGNDLNFLGTFTRRVAEAYAIIGKRKESIVWYTKAYHLYDHSFIFVPTYELVTQLVYDGQAGKALEILNRTIKRFPVEKDPLKYCIDLAYAETYTALNQYKRAAPYFALLKELEAKDTSATEISALINFHLTEYYYAQHFYPEARAAAQRSLHYKVYVTLPMRIRLYKLLYEIDMLSKMPEQAIEHLEKFHKLQDSVFTQEKLNTIERLQIEFNASQKENENEILRRKSQLQQQKLERAELIKKATIASIIFLIIVIILLYNRFNLKRKVHNILMTQKKAIDLAYQKLEISIIQKNKLIDDKERLVREVHHRVKNNLQLTMSLLNTQSYYLKDSSAISAIQESQHRLKSIALIHQKLYQTEDVAVIHINLYIAELLNYLRDSLGDGKKISFELNLCPLETDIALAVPIGLFINEAITNIYKYAFAETGRGKVQVSLVPHTEKLYLLEIRDNGSGLSPDFDILNSRTLGMTLMKGLSSQIEGELIVKSEAGLSVSLIFENLASIGYTGEEETGL
jgi:two-component sensor histidine kinase